MKTYLHTHGSLAHNIHYIHTGLRGLILPFLLQSDGKADYVWTSAIDGSVQVWLNNYPNSPTWLAEGEIAGGVGTSGACVRWGTMYQLTGASYIAVNPNTGAISAWLSGCDSDHIGPGPTANKVPH